MSSWQTIYEQNTREFVLSRDSLIPVTYDHRGKVVSGLWVDPYTARVSRDPADQDIEHSVSLKEAHEAGAWKLSPMQKARLSQDPDGLYATWRSSNRFKGARSMVEYLPSVITFIDDYAAKRRIIAERYGLQFSQCERLALRYFRGYGKYFERGIKLSKVKAWVAVHRPIFGHRCFQ